MIPLRRVGRDIGALTDEESRYIESEIIGAAWAELRAREIFPTEPGPNVANRTIRRYTETDMSQAVIDMEGESISIDRTQLDNSDIKLPTIHKEFVINWRDLEARGPGMPLDLREARNAARQVAEEENMLCFTGEHTGWFAYGIQGLSQVTGRNVRDSAGAWPATAITDINAAIALLEGDGYTKGPYVLVAPATLIRGLMVTGGAGYEGKTYLSFMLDNKILDGYITDDMLLATAGATTSAVICVPGKDNFALSVARDITVFTKQLPNMNLFGRVYEVVTPNIKRPSSICEIYSI